MSGFGWTRLAYLTVILTVLAILVKLGTFGANPAGESFPTSILAFAPGEGKISAEHLEWGNRPKERPEALPDDSDHGSGEHSEDEARRDHSHEPVESLYENVNFAEDAPVFYRPTPRVSSDSRNPASSSGMAEKSCQTVGDAPPGSEIVFPVTREHFDSYDDTWGAARPQGGHEGTDLMVPNGTPLLAMTDSRVVPVSGANENGWNTLGGYTVMLEAAYSVGPVKKGDLFYYAHLDRGSDLAIGDVVEAGDVVGFAGDTGQGPEGERGQFPPHLHLGWYETSGERTQLASGAMNPYPLLEWVKSNGGSIAGGSDVPYCEAPQSSAPTPSTGGYWQFPSDPGTRPDMSTGTGTAVPSPVVEENDSSESSPDVTREPRVPEKPAPPRENTDERPGGSQTPRPDEATDERPDSEPNTPPRFPNIPNPLPANPLPGLGDGIRDIIDGVINGGGSNPRPPRDGDPRDDGDPPESTAPPEDTESAEDPPETTTPETTTPEASTPDEEDECEPDERTSRKGAGETSPESENGEECSDDANLDEEAPSEETSLDEETTDVSPDDAVGDQYERNSGENSNAGEDSPETNSPEKTSET